jgi:hypothetical protein
VAITEERTNAYKVWGGRVGLEETDHLEDLGADGRKTLQLILKKIEWKALTGLNWLRIGTSGGRL